MPRLRVTVVASRLFAPTHHSLARLATEVSAEVDVRFLAKHPEPHPETGTPAPEKLELASLGPVWRPDAAIVHAVGGGETAIRVSAVLSPEIPLIVSFVGVADLTRQLTSPRLREGYVGLFARARTVLCPSGAEPRLVAAGADQAKIVPLPVVLPLASYPCAAPQQRTALWVGRASARKRLDRVWEVVRLTRSLDDVVCVGPAPDLSDPISGIRCLGPLRHGALVTLLAQARVLLYCGDTQGEETDHLPTVLLEALAVGVPVVSTPITGAVDLHRRFPGVVKLAEDTDGLAKAIESVILGVAAPEVEQARRFILTQHAPSVVAAALLKIYRAVLGAAPPS